ncbi:MAG TPA: hypothetical protein VM187_05590, partial [Niastella sp.]|nr:hypothetical protein [Niastella sp.]
ISNFFMLVTGITIARLGNLKGWRRYVPLAVGCWLPLGFVLWALFTRTPGVLLTLSIYSLVMWSLMAISIITFRTNTTADNVQLAANRRKRQPNLATYLL